MSAPGFVIDHTWPDVAVQAAARMDVAEGRVQAGLALAAEIESEARYFPHDRLDPKVTARRIRIALGLEKALDPPPAEPWTAYVRGFGEHIGKTLYETARLAREDSGPGERIYRITHIETVTPEGIA